MPMSDPHGPAVIVDPYSSGAFFAPAFQSAGVQVIAVVSAPTPPSVYASSYRKDDFSKILVADDDLSPIVRELLALRPRCVLAGCESGVELADAVAAQVVPDVAHVPGKAQARRHKGAMAQAVAEAGLPIIAQLCTDDAYAVGEWIEKNGLQGRDLVIKPPKSASTDGVTRVSQGQGWREVFQQMLGTKNRLGICNDQLVVQEFATGTEYVIDFSSYAGHHAVADVCRYHKINNGPYFAVYDRMEWLAPDVPEAQPLVQYARSVLDAVGVRYGTAHVEVMLTPNGPRLIEIGARPHGGGHPRFCREATGDSQVDRIVRNFTSGNVPDSYQLKKHTMAVFFICRTAGIVTNVEALEKVRDLQSHYFSMINIHNHDRLEPTKDLFGSLDMGFVVLSHPDYAQIQQDYQRVRDLENQLQYSNHS